MPNVLNIQVSLSLFGCRFVNIIIMYKRLHSFRKQLFFAIVGELMSKLLVGASYFYMARFSNHNGLFIFSFDTLCLERIKWALIFNLSIFDNMF